MINFDWKTSFSRRYVALADPIIVLFTQTATADGYSFRILTLLDENEKSI